MAFIDKTFDFEYGSDNTYVIDAYANNPEQKSLEINKNGNIQLRNISDNTKSNNFYGDGRDGVFQKMNTNNMNPRSGYVAEVKNHDVYGWCLYKTWFQTDDFQTDDEIVIYKKHIQHEMYLGELGEWEYLTINEKIIDSEGIHYTIKDSPTNTYTEYTANAISMVYQYQSLKILDNQNFKIDMNSSTIVDMPSWLWNGRRVSHPCTVLAIKSQDEIEIGKNAFIGSLYGYNGGNAYNTYATTQQYADPGAPLGCGSDDSVKSTFVLRPDIRDTRSSGNFRLFVGSYAADGNAASNDNNNVFGSGGIDSYGIKHTADTFYGNPMPKSLDLNNNVYCGIGGSTYYMSGYGDYRYLRETHQTMYGYGRAGGGICIIQTPKIVFKENGKINCGGTATDRRRALGYGGGGAILLKAEEIINQMNPELSSFYNNLSVYRDINNSTFSTVNNLMNAYTNYISPPGQIQLEFDKWITEYDNEEYTPITVTVNHLKDHVYDFYSNYVKDQTIGLNGTVNKWDSKELKFSHNHTSPLYETDKYFKLLSTPLTNINLETWTELESLKAQADLPDGTDIRMLLSTDNKATWNYVDTSGPNPLIKISSLSESDLTNKSNTIEEFANFINSAFLSNTFVFSQRTKENKTIDVCIAIKTTKNYITPLFDRLWFNYNEVSVIQAPIPMSPYNGEEFNNEFVNFVWLQPESKYGSIQNRIEINTVPNFERSMLNITPNREENSSSNNKIHLPYKPMLFDNKSNTCNYFKLPYMKKRFGAIENANDVNLPSMNWSSSTRSVNYIGKDVFFRKGSTVELSPGSIALPPLSSMNFKLDAVGIPRPADFKHHFKFYNMTSVTKATFNDTKNPSMFDTADSRTIQGEFGLAPTLLHGDVPKFNKSTKSYNRLILKPDESTMGDSHSEGTFLIRFIPDSMTINENNYIIGLQNLSWGNYHSYLLTIYPYIEEGELYYRFGYYTYNTWSYGYYKAPVDKSEQVIVITHMPGGNGYGNAEIYYNGIKIISSLYGRHPSHLASHTYALCLGCDYNSYTNIAYRYVGSIIEIGYWETSLTEQEIKDISKIPVYHIRYNLNTNILETKQVPYKDHLSEYKYVQDNVDNLEINGDKYRFSVSNQHFAMSNSEVYNNNHNGLLFGTYVPYQTENASFYKSTQIHKPIDGIPFLYSRFGHDKNAYKNVLVYHDSNTVSQRGNYAVQWQHMSPHQRIDSNKDNVTVSFVFRDINGLSMTPAVGILTGVLNNNSHLTTDASFSRRYLLRYNPTSKKFELYVAMMHTNSVRYVIKSWVELSIPPKDNHIYHLEMIANDNIKNTELWLKSPTDSNYQLGVKIHDPADTTYIHYSYGYDSDDFKDIVPGVGNRYEDVGLTFQTGEENALQIIDLAVSNDTSNMTQQAGYESRYDIFKSITKDGLNKINEVDFKGTNTGTEADVRVFFSFDGGNTYKNYNFGTNVWTQVNANVASNGIKTEDIVKITEYQFASPGGFQKGYDVVIRIVLTTSSPFSTSLLDYIDISYNGPMIIDSWKDVGTFYNGTQFYFTEGAWSPYLETDFLDETQEWQTMGTKIPKFNNWNIDLGSKGSFGSRKVFGGCRILLNPKGRYYWRVAAYNGL